MERADRQAEVARLKALGKSNRAIAKAIGVDEGTVRNDLKDLRNAAAELAAARQIVAVAIHHHRERPDRPNHVDSSLQL